MFLAQCNILTSRLGSNMCSNIQRDTLDNLFSPFQIVAVIVATFGLAKGDQLPYGYAVRIHMYSKDPNKRACTFIFFKKKNQPALSLLETARLFLFLLFLRILIFYLIKLTYLFNGCSFIWVPFYPARDFLFHIPVGGHAYLRGLCY